MMSSQLSNIKNDKNVKTIPYNLKKYALKLNKKKSFPPFSRQPNRNLTLRNPNAICEHHYKHDLLSKQ